VTHIRTQIREAMQTALDTNLPAGQYDVYASRKYARNHTGKAAIDMRFLNENITRETMGAERIRISSFYLRVQRSEAEADLDDALDVDEVNVIAAVVATDWSALLEEEPELVQVNFSSDAETGLALGGLVMRYDVEYRADYDDPETVRT